jgi:putative ubiquitin-RnfH superfamily antitoxin RatB of RatAB toxin-antitoxin module
MDKRIDVEVVYALPHEQRIFIASGEPGMTLDDAVKQSRILEHYPELDWASMDAGVFGKQMPKDSLLNPGDRVELYRPLIADPKEMRKKRAAEGKVMRRGGGDSGTEPDSD